MGTYRILRYSNQLLTQHLLSAPNRFIRPCFGKHGFSSTTFCWQKGPFASGADPLSQLGDKNIILMGSPGSGKTTIGQMLGSKIKRPSLDIDNDFLEKEWKMPVADKLFSVGSEKFLKAEGEALLNFTASGSVISLSGSNPMHKEAMDHIKKTGLVVYMDVKDADILDRLAKMKVMRIVGQEVDVPMPDILKYRKQFYEGNYDIRVTCTANETLDSIMDRVIHAIHEYYDHSGYVSTREDMQTASPRTFNEAVLEGLAWDGGLFVPMDSFPSFTNDEWLRLVGKSYPDRAVQILEKWIHPTNIHSSNLRTMVDNAYTVQNFNNEKIFPVEKLYKDSVYKNQYILELFHGPTASFKDSALQLAPMFFEHAMKKVAEENERYLVLVATSGDTGGAVLDGFAKHTDKSSRMQVMVLYPVNGISSIQKAQMTAAQGENIHVVGVKSDFDFCQTAIKNIFSDRQLAADLKKDCGCKLTAANSINWGRLLPQVVHHCSAYLDLVESKTIMMGEPVDLCVPTGNFGNILAAFYAQEMGIPFRRLISASNANNVLSEFLNTGHYTLQGRTLSQTGSPAIDILKSSNLERLLHYATYGDHTKVREFYENLDKHGRFQMTKQNFRNIKRTFHADWCTEDACLRAIQNTYKQTGYLMDPHTAVGKVVADKYFDEHVPMVIASTAHYAKFAPVVLKALGISQTSDDPKSLFSELEALQASPGMHVALKDGVLREKQHHKVLEPRVGDIVKEMKDFVKSR